MAKLFCGKRRHSDQTVHPCFALEQTVSERSARLERGLLHSDSAFCPRLAKRPVNSFHAPSFLFAIALVHSLEHRGPILRILAACARANAQDGVCPVVFSRKKCLDLLLPPLPAQAGLHLFWKAPRAL